MKNDKCEYQNDGVRITAPGKFEGCPVFAPHYWQIGLEGFADSDNGQVFTFKFTNKELGNHGQDHLWATELRIWLGRSRTLKMREDSQGFVHCF